MIFKRITGPDYRRLAKELRRRGENLYEHDYIESFGLLHPAEANKFFVEVPEEVPEGIVNQQTKDGSAIDRAISITELRCIDLLCEGEIEGPVVSEYLGEGTEGNIGFDKVIEKVFAEVGIQGEAVGSGLKWLKSIRWNKVPVLNGLNKLNYQQVDMKFSPGVQAGGVSDGLSNPLTVNRPIGERFRGGGDSGDEFAKVYRILNPRCKGIGATVKVNQLMFTEKIDTDAYGDIRDTSVTYHIYYRPIWNIQNKPEESFVLGASETVTGRASWPYLKQSNFTFGNMPNIGEEGHLGWEIKFLRDTDESLDTGLRNQTFIDSFFEVYGDVFKYPNSVCFQSKFSAEFFQSIPDRQFDIRGLQVLVPADYNVITKKYQQTYKGTLNPYWRGNFKDEKEWTDNPAWCFYDILTNKRYGLGKYIEGQFVDKWTLYDISQYCDGMVPDGYGGQEPRFTCNMLILSRDEAYKVVNDMASIFRAVTYFAGGTIRASQDSKKESLTVFTNANVENGNFTYSSSARKARHTVAIVKYKDKRHEFENAVEYVEDLDGIRKYGIREIEMAGVGITSRGQAHRYGKWALLSEQVNTDTITFNTGLEGATLRPGDVIGISDYNKHAKRYGGRTIRVDTDMITIFDYVIPGVRIILDSKIDVIENGTYRLTLLTPTYQYDTSIVASAIGADTDSDKIDSRDIGDIRRGHLQTLDFVTTQVTADSEGRSIITVGWDGGDKPLINVDDYDVSNYLVWMVEPTGETVFVQSESVKKIQEFKILNISEKDPNIYNVHALEYIASKFDAVDGIADFEDDITSPETNAPVACFLTQKVVTANTKKISYQIIPPSDTSNILSYLVYIKVGTPFNGADFDDSLTVYDPVPTIGTPKDSFLLASHPRDDLEGDYIPQQDGKYYFRIYSANRIGSASLTGIDGEDTNGNPYIEVAGVNPILDTSIFALTLSTETFEKGDDVYKAGTTATQIMDLAEPTYAWKVSINGESPAVTYDYKITIRAPSNSNVPHHTIYYETTLTNRTPQQLAWKWGLSEHMNNVSVFFGKATMLRDYDIVVEAINSAGASSAGSFTQGQGFSNSAGYDILNVKNPNIGYMALTEADQIEDCEDTSATWCSDQWLTNDGDVKILFNKGPTSLNVAMGVLWISPNEDAIKNATTANLLNDSYLEAHDIRQVLFKNNSNNPMGIDITMVNYKEGTGYITVAFGDRVDGILLQESLDRDNPAISPVPGLATTRSNVVKVVSRGDFVALHGTGFFRKYISGKWEGGLGGGISIKHSYGLSPIYSVEKRDAGAGFITRDADADFSFAFTRTYNSDSPNQMFDQNPYGNHNHYNQWWRGAGTNQTKIYARSYLITYKFSFDRPMSNNEYHVVFIPGLSTAPDNCNSNPYADIIEHKVAVLTTNAVGPTTNIGKIGEFGLMGDFKGRGQDKSAYGDYAGRGGTGKSIPVHIYKAAEGFAIKMQVSEKCHGLFDEVPVYIGIVSASG